MTVTVYTRHSTDCPHKYERNHKGCRCPKWLQYQINGDQKKKSAKTRSWGIATKKARQLETDLELAALGETPANRKHHRVEEAVGQYQDHKFKPSFNTDSKRRVKAMMRRLQEWCDKRGILYLKDASPITLQEWRDTWTFKPNSYSLKVHNAVVAAFFDWAHRIELIPRNPWDKLDGITVKPVHTLPLTPEEMKRILDAVNKCGWDAATALKIRTFILLQRWSGLAITDATTLQRSALDDTGALKLYRLKTGTDVFTVLPEAVAELLQATPNSNPLYFFWDGKVQKHSAVNDYGDYLREVFDKAGIPRGNGMMLSHRFRDTFAVELLNADVALEDVSRLLGHTSIKTTQDHYGRWVTSRQKRLATIVTTANAKMQDVPEIKKRLPPSKSGKLHRRSDSTRKS
jgi:integrase/recombinase XerD